MRNVTIRNPLEAKEPKKNISAMGPRNKMNKL